jgi:hypothetical protein
MIKIKPNCIVPSAAYSVPKAKLKLYDSAIRKIPEVGDLVYGEVETLAHHDIIENRSGRLHTLNVGTRAIFVFGNRYAPDQYEGLVPNSYKKDIDLYSRGGVVGTVNEQNQLIGACTKVRLLGYVCDSAGNIVNTRNWSLIQPKSLVRLKSSCSPLILCIGTSMNSGKSHAAAACCYALASMEKSVRAAKITGTAGLKDILLMNDCGADYIADFSYFGHPSTYLLKPDQLYNMFNTFDLKYGNNLKNYLVMEFADGIYQRETAMLLAMPEVRARIFKLVFCASDSSGVHGGIRYLKEKFDLVPDAISGLCSSSPLAIREIKTFTNTPVLESMEKDYKKICKILGVSEPKTNANFSLPQTECQNNETDQIIRI